MTSLFKTGSLLGVLLTLWASGCAHPDAADSTPIAQASAAPASNSAPVVNAVQPAPDLERNPASARPAINPALPSLFVAGDSTAARSSSPIQQGWGVPLAAYFDPTKVNVVNRARGGRSSRTYVTEGLWDQLLADVKPGDIILIQFGTNDGGPVNDERRARGSLPGLGEETQEIDNLVTKQHEVVHTYGWYLRKMISDAQAKGAKPVVLSLTVRNIWKEGRVERGSGRYGEWAAATAKAAGVPFIDVAGQVADEFETMEEENVKLLYQRDHTHFNPEGADLHARVVVQGLKALPDQPANALLSSAGQAVEAKSTAPRPARDVPRVGPVHAGFNTNLPTLWLIGDSTVKNGRDDGGGGLWGWGNPIAAYFDRSKINVENQALGGTSSRSYLNTKLWEAVRVQIKPGDFVIMQFGHNDGGGAYDDDRARKSIKGSGDETVEVVLQKTGQKEVVHTYGWYLRQYIADTKAQGATPLVCSLIPRNDWKNGRVLRADDSYAKWAREAAIAGGAFFFDLNAFIADIYDDMGQEAVKPFFPKEHTHPGWEGALLNAQCVVAGIRGFEDLKLREYLDSDPKPPRNPSIYAK
jgi:lysophospholipase L1-like esterase